MGVLVLTDPVVGTTTDATLIAANDAAIKAVINGNIDASNFGAGLIFNPNKIQQGGALTGQALVWDGAKFAPGSVGSGELSYVEVASDVTFTNAAQVALATSASITLDGATAIFVEYWTGEFSQATGSRCQFHLWEDAVDLGVVATNFNNPAGVSNVPMFIKARKRTPAAGAHTYTIKGIDSGGTSTARGALDDGGTALLPAFLRVVKA